jgi:hypothetical protein
MTKLLEESRHLFGNGDEDQETTDRNILLMVSSMPLLSILMFQQEMLDGTAEQTVDALLSQVHDGEA